MSQFLKIIWIWLSVIVLFVPKAEAENPSHSWRDWSDSQFKEAQESKKLVLLNLEATWCHWCHVMQTETYANEQVQKLISDAYIAVKVDQDSRPDLAVRYADWGWPATVIFDSTGNELAKRAGYIEKADFLSLLTRIAEKPIPEDSGPAVSLTSNAADSFSPELLAALRDKHYRSFDGERGGLKISHKFLDADSVEYSLKRSLLPDGQKDAAMAALTLRNNLKLLDPIWGGIYQYSTGGVWDRPHYEKLMSAQAKNMRIYSFASIVAKERSYLDSAYAIYKYVTTFLRDSNGAFYVSQDADLRPGERSDEYFLLSDAERRKLGVPRIDKNIYSRENGWIVEALAALYAAAGDSEVRDTAVASAAWILTHRSLPGGGFSHGDSDAAGPYLGDSLAMGRACLTLYTITAERKWLNCADSSAQFIYENFTEADSDNMLPGIVSTAVKKASVLKSVRDLDENISVARFGNLLFHYTGKEVHRSLAHVARRYLAIPEVASEHVTDSGILIVADELSRDPLHITIVSNKKDKRGIDLFQASLKYPDGYKRVEWLDRGEGPLPNPDIEYPVLPRAAAFVCSNRRCSLPVFDVNGLEGVIKRFNR